jgi:tRNA(fMet)-specific endonuclease VapC
MKYLLDTNAVSYYLRGVPATVKHIHGHKPSALAISTVTAMELAYGMERRQSESLSTAINGFLSGIQILPFDFDAAKQAGVIRAAMERVGVTFSLADSQIAGHVIALGLTLISTDNAFKRVRGLTMKDWSRS